MKKIIQHKLHFRNDTINIEVSTHKGFIKCIEDEPSPFKSAKNIINPEIDIDSCEKIIIKCFISEDERQKILSAPLSESGMGICHEVVEKFIKSNWNKGEQLLQMESLNCNQYEQQYKFAILK